MSASEDGLASDPVVSVLGRMSIATAAGQHSPGTAGQRLLAMLAAAHPDPVAHDIVAEGVYPAAAVGRARRALQSTVWRVRQAAGGELIVTEPGAYRLGVGRADVDLTRFEDLAMAARDALLRNSSHEAEERARSAVVSWVGEPFVGLHDVPGVEGRAAAATATLGAVVEDWADAAIRLGDPREVLDRLVDLTDSEPLRERAWALRLDAFRAIDQWDDVARTRALVLDALAQVGVEPGPELRAALGRCRRPTAPIGGQAGSDPGTDTPLPGWMRVVAEQGPFIGRDTELELLRNAIDDAGDGRTRVVVVRGEPGAGKTRLAVEVARAAAADGSTTVLGGRCDRYGLIPFAPLIDPLRHMAELADPAAAGRFSGGPLGRLLDPGSGPVNGTEDAAADQIALFAAVADLVRVVATARTIVLVVDDLQWASSATALLVRHLAASGADQRLCIVATARPREAPRPSDIDPVSMLSSVGGASTIALGGLTSAEIATHPDIDADPQSDGVAGELVTLTGGNPLLLATVLRSRQEGGGDRPSSPLILEAAIEAHLERFGSTTRDLLGLVAAAGADVDPMLLRAAARSLGTSASEVNEAFDAAEEAGIISLTGGGRYTFRHQLLRDVLLDTLPRRRRARFHAALADAIVQTSDISGTALFELADHLHSARSIVPPERIEAVTTQAADTAAADLDFDAAGRHYERAAAAGARAGSPHQAPLLLEAALCRRCVGDPDSALPLIDAAISAADRPDVLGRAVVERGRHDLKVECSITDATVELAESALGQIEAPDLGVAGELWSLRILGDRRATHPADLLPTGDPEIALDAGLRAFRFAGPGHRPGLAERTGALADEFGDAPTRASALVAGWLVDIERGTGHIDDPAASADLDRLVDSGPDDPASRWMRDSWAAARDFAAGRLTQARQAMDASYARTQGAALPVGERARIRSGHRGQLLAFAMLTGLTDRVDRIVEPVHRYSADEPLSWDAAQILAMLQTGRIEEAARRFADACDRALAPGMIISDLLFTQCLLAGAADGFGDQSRAARIRDALLPWRGYAAVAGHVHAFGGVDHWLGITHRCIGDFDLAVETFAAARDQHQRQGMGMWFAVSTTGLIRTLVARDEPGDRAEAVSLADEVGPWAAEVGLGMVSSQLEAVTAPLR